MSRWRGWPAADGRLLLKVLGTLLLLAGVGLVAVTENGVLDYRRASERHGGEVHDLGSRGQPDASLHDGMVRVSGPVHVVAPPRDVDFNQTADTPVLVRKVEMFQWREIRVGGDAHYELDWVDHAVDSSRFLHPGGHFNPGAFPVKGQRIDSTETHVGAFILSPTLLHALPGSDRMKPDANVLPPNLAATFSADGDYLVTSEHPDSPRLGDLRVSWSTVPLQTVTVVARLDGALLVPAQHADDGRGFEIQVGERPLVDVFPDLPVPPDGVLPRRIVALLLAACGVLALLWDRRERFSDLLLALGVGALLIGAVAAVIWMGGHGRTGLYWLAVAALGLAVSAWPLWCRFRRGDSSRR